MLSGLTEINSIYSWKRFFANISDIISQMKENSQACYHRLWRKQSNFQDIYHNLATMALASKESGEIAVHFGNSSRTFLPGHSHQDTDEWAQ